MCEKNIKPQIEMFACCSRANLSVDERPKNAENQSIAIGGFALECAPLKVPIPHSLPATYMGTRSFEFEILYFSAN